MGDVGYHIHLKMLQVKLDDTREENAQLRALLRLLSKCESIMEMRLLPVAVIPPTPFDATMDQVASRLRTWLEPDHK